MKYALLVAAREFEENAATKGFWIGVFLLPAIILVSIFAVTLLNKATPTRYIAVNDQSGQYLQKIEHDLDRLHQMDVLKAFSEYAQKYTVATGKNTGDVDLEKVPAVDVEKAIARFAENDPETLNRFVNEGGIVQALWQIAPYLVENAPAFEEPKVRYAMVDLPNEIVDPSDLDTSAGLMKEYLTEKKKIMTVGKEHALFAYVQIPSDVANMVKRPNAAKLMQPDKNHGVQYWSINLADTKARDVIERVVNEETRRLEFVDQGVDAEAVARVQRTYVPFVSLNAKKEEGEEHVSVADQIRQWAPTGFVYVLWIVLFSISQLLLNNTVEEKSNRIIFLLSSVTVWELMFGKLIGIAAVGLAMLLSWVGSLMAILYFMQSPETRIATTLLEVLSTSGLIPAFAIYFILGFLMYSGLFLAIGSVCNTLKDAQNMQSPIMMLMMIPLFTIVFIPKDPNGTVATVMSWIPPFTPFVMMNRAAADPPLLDVVGTMMLLVVTTIVMLYLAGKIFRIGILRTGQPPKLKELYAWLRI